MINQLFSILIYLNAFFTLLIIGPLFVVLAFVLPKYWMYKLSKLVCIIILKSLFVKIKVKVHQWPTRRFYLV